MYLKGQARTWRYTLFVLLSCQYGWICQSFRLLNVKVADNHRRPRLVMRIWKRCAWAWASNYSEPMLSAPNVYWFSKLHGLAKTVNGPKWEQHPFISGLHPIWYMIARQSCLARWPGDWQYPKAKLMEHSHRLIASRPFKTPLYTFLYFLINYWRTMWIWRQMETDVFASNSVLPRILFLGVLSLTWLDILNLVLTIHTYRSETEKVW
jgi:hypothetical protein